MAVHSLVSREDFPKQVPHGYRLTTGSTHLSKKRLAGIRSAGTMISATKTIPPLDLNEDKNDMVLYREKLLQWMTASESQNSHMTKFNKNKNINRLAQVQNIASI